MTAVHPLSSAQQPQRKRFTLEEYLRMAQDGYFADERTEFIDGEILDMPPQKNPHAFAVSMLVRVLDREVGQRHWVRQQATLKIGTIAAPEPDVAVVAGPPSPEGDYPAAALLVVEVSDTTLEYDRATKGSLYAFARIPEYWIVNLIERRIEIHREPAEDRSAQFGWRYGRIDIAAPGAEIPLPASLGAGGGTLRVADVVP